MADKLNGKVAIVTGSGQGIGKAVAMALAAEGAKVVTNNRKQGTQGGDAATVAAEIKAAGGEAIPFFGSVSDFKEAQQAIQTAVKTFGRIDIVVNNAGSDAPKMVWNMSEEEWDLSVDSFLKSSFNMIRHAAPLMREQKWGRIINTTSTAWLGTVGHCNYGAAKAGIVGLTRALPERWDGAVLPATPMLLRQERDSPSAKISKPVSKNVLIPVSLPKKGSRS